MCGNIIEGMEMDGLPKMGVSYYFLFYFSLLPPPKIVSELREECLFFFLYLLLVLSFPCLDFFFVLLFKVTPFNPS